MLRGWRRASPPTSLVSQLSGMRTTLVGMSDGESYKVLFFVCVCVLTRSLHSHQESHSLAGEERRSQSGESETQAVFLPHHQKLQAVFVFKTFMNTSYYLDNAALVNVVLIIIMNITWLWAVAI